MRARGARRTSTPRRRPQAASRSRRREFAATPPETVRSGKGAASRRRSSRSSICATTDSWNAARRSREPPGASSSARTGPAEGDAGVRREAERGEPVADGRLQPGEGEVERAPLEARHGERLDDPAGPGEAVDDGPAGVAEPGHLRHLVVGLARGVVPRPREEGDPLRGEREDVRVPSRDDEGREAGRERPRGRAVEVEERGERVPLDVVARDERDAEAEGDSPRLREADEKRPDEAGAGRRDDEAHVLEPGARPLERLVQERREVRQVGPGRDLRDDPAVAAVHVDLRGDDGRDDRAVLPEEGDGGLVAGALEAEDEAHGRARRRASPSACGGTETPGLGDDGVDERGRRDVEGGVEGRDARRGDRERAVARRVEEEDLGPVPPLDRDLRPGGAGGVERRPGSRDDERDAVRPAGEGDAVGPDLVRDVAVRGDPVGADDRGRRRARTR